MAHDKLIDSAKLDGAMTATADAIRGKTGKNADIPWNESTGFASEIASIQTETAPKLQSKSATPSTSAQTVKPDSGYDGLSQVTVNAMPTATQATPSISVSSAGLITAAATQTAGYVAAGTKSATKQLTTQAAKTITPGTTDQNAVASGVYTTGAITVKGDANLKAENIAEGVSIFGVAGAFKGGGNVATGYVTITYATQQTLTVTGLGFKPSNVMLFLDGYYSGTPQSAGYSVITFTNFKKAITAFIATDEYHMCQQISEAATTEIGGALTVTSGSPYTGYYYAPETGFIDNVKFGSGSFTIKTIGTSCVFKSGGTYRYVAW